MGRNAPDNITLYLLAWMLFLRLILQKTVWGYSLYLPLKEGPARHSIHVKGIRTRKSPSAK